MSKKEEFKSFISKNPDFVESVRNGETTWQRMYELYDLYGENSKIWDNYRNVEETTEELKEEKKSTVKDIFNSLKNINVDALQENISSLQKAVSFLEDIALTTKKEDKEDKPKKQKKSTPTIDRFFDD